jgi:hypothetical protein
LIKSASTTPGETEITLIFGASARAKDFVRLSTAAFDAQYTMLLPIAITPAIDEMLTMSAASLWSSSTPLKRHLSAACGLTPVQSVASNSGTGRW